MRAHRAVNRWIGPLWVWGVLIALYVLAVYTVPEFATFDNFKNILKQAVPLAIVSIGQTAVIIQGGIDLSVAAVMSMGDTLTMGIMNGGSGSILFAIVAPLGVGLLIGAANGLVVSKTAAPAFIVTLGAASIVQGAVFWYTHSAPYGAPSLSFGELGFKEIGPLPALVVLFIPILIDQPAGPEPDQGGPTRLRGRRRRSGGGARRDRRHPGQGLDLRALAASSPRSPGLPSRPERARANRSPAPASTGIRSRPS